jgi:hypothetical protein
MARICLVTPSHPTSNPRLVKEAGALHAAGHEVVVIAGRYFPPLDPFDDALLAASPWRCIRVHYDSGPGVMLAKLRRRLARRLVTLRPQPGLGVAIHAHHAAIGLLAAAARRERADLYIGHCLAGLAAAGLASRATGASLGFDAEDLHSAETFAAETDPVEIATIRRIESAFLPLCHHFTAASPLIGEAYAERYGVAAPLTLLNVFPLAEAPAAPVAPERPQGRALLYWFSQTIGAGRGLEELIPTLALLRSPVALRLRGLPEPGFPDALRTLARSAGFTGPIEFAPIGPPAEMARLAAGADLGLSLEQTRPLNRDLCLTNKIFTYLLAGVPVALSSTRAQRALAPELGDAAILPDFSHPARAAAQLDQCLSDPAHLASARATAWHSGHSRYNWDAEQQTLNHSIRRLFL